jgi:hypothetical protein
MYVCMCIYIYIPSFFLHRILAGVTVLTELLLLSECHKFPCLSLVFVWVCLFVSFFARAYFIIGLWAVK